MSRVEHPREPTEDMQSSLKAHEGHLLERRTHLSNVLRGFGFIEGSMSSQQAEVLRSEAFRTPPTEDDDGVDVNIGLIAELLKRREGIDSALVSESTLMLSYVQAQYEEIQGLRFLIETPDGDQLFKDLEEDPINRPVWREKVVLIEANVEKWRTVYFWHTCRRIGPPNTEENLAWSAHHYGPDCVDTLNAHFDGDGLDLDDIEGEPSEKT
jgi:hypothetical protein